jgi:chorismate dehydratase
MARPRVASVSFLNAKPLIYGLREDEVELFLDVPSRLLSGLEQGNYDVALLPVADLPALPGATVVPVGGIACDGPTLTVRIFSDRPLEKIDTLLCDTDSHTSVALARIILKERFGARPTFKPLTRGARPAGPCLLIGDKVISDAPEHLPIQADLGEQWKLLTGLPFVFAAWTARPGYEATALSAILARARESGLAHVQEIVETHAAQRRWPAETARKYFTEYLQYRLTDRHLEGMKLFLSKLGH